MYGPTETTIWSMVKEIAPDTDRITIGKPIGNTKVYVLDTNLQIVPIGVPGELYIGGKGLALGYLNRQELTAERFIPVPENLNRYGAGERLYKTGDLVKYLSDGEIEFLGRMDNQVKLRGYRIELGEIEAVCRQHPAIQEVEVMPRELAEGDTRLVAYVKYDSKDEPTVSELRKYLKEKLPDYMVPSIFLSLDTFPLTPNGKVDRKNLPVPAGMSTGNDQAHVEPGTPMEKLMAEVWQEVLGINGFSVNDNFFDIGGHSLLSMKIVYEIKKKLDIQINPREIMFKNLGQLAAFCEELSNSGTSSKRFGKGVLKIFKQRSIK